jgi:DNA-binding LacI/PurR family transcriptional regulator
VSARAPTAQDVARLAGVSQSAVSRAFTPGASVSAPMRDRVLKAAEALGYRPNLIARSLITRRSGMIGVAVGNLSNHIYPRMLEALSERLQAAGYRILLFTAPRDGSADPELEQVLRYQVDALVLAATMLSSRVADECRAAGVPVILFNRTSGTRGICSVTGQNREGARAIAELLADASHVRPAFLAGSERASTSRDRERGFREGCAARGLPEPAVEIGDFSQEGARVAMRTLLRRRPRPDAVFCASDSMAIVAMDVARHDFGLRVPQDLSIVGFDDAPPASWPAYALTTWAQPVDDMVDATATLLAEQLAGSAPARHEVLPGRLVLRGSCRLPALAEASA